MASEFKGNVALVTGCSSGIGKDSALAFAQKGAKVALAARRVSEGQEVVERIKEIGGDAIFVPTDVSKPLEVEALINECIATYGRLDYAFNNAGIEGSQYIPTADYTEETWNDVININLKGVWLSMKYEIPQILKQGKGAIVNMSSVAGLAGSLIGCAYIASKHGVIGLTKAAALEYADQGVRVNAVCPAVIQTPMADRLYNGDAEIENRLTALHPMGRVGTPQEVADAVVWLCSESASFVTGHSMAIDGGFLAK
jgi:NAD(P)-dependent dehydrogenase (short-subunit alcohol dehydrogenase family)